MYWCYSEWQKLYDELPGVQCHKGLVDTDSIDPRRPNILVLDDMMNECDQKVVDWFTKHSNHRNTLVILITQNLYEKSPCMRTMNLNSSYIVLLKDPREDNQINFLARQMCPNGKSKFMLDAYLDASSVPYEYLLADLKQTTDDILRLRMGTFPDERTYTGFSPAWALGRSAHFSNQSAQSARLVVVMFCLVSLPMRLYLISCGL